MQSNRLVFDCQCSSSSLYAQWAADDSLVEYPFATAKSPVPEVLPRLAIRGGTLFVLRTGLPLSLDAS